MLLFDCRPVDVGRDEEVVPLELPRFEVLSVFIEIKLRSLADDLRTVVVAVLELLSELLSFLVVRCRVVSLVGTDLLGSCVPSEPSCFASSSFAL